MIRRPTRLLTALLLLAGTLAPLGLGASPAAATDYTPITGSGSTWSQVAVDAWRADIRSSGVVVNFTGNGSTAGRSDYIQAVSDFVTTEIPFQNPPEPGQQAEVPKRPYAYLPIVAGGTSFMYNLTVGGQRVRDLRLSGPTIAKIFTGKITRWNDAAITHDYGRKLPDIPIVPVVRADGAGASAQFTRYMGSQAGSVYCPFIRDRLHLGGGACPSVSFYPSFGTSKAQVGSNGVANYVSANYGQGAIGYVEYAYAKRINFPVVSLLNRAGYFVQPTAGNVSVALTRARINSDLTQNLDSVYSNSDPRAYPMSSYSYMVVPTNTARPFNTAKGKTLSTFINYFLCGGQQKADILGYSPLPKNLVLAGFNQVRRIPGSVSPPSIDKCNNPALRILQTAPAPSHCQKLGAVCGASVVPAAGASGATTGSGGSSTTSQTPGAATGTGTGTSGSGGGGVTAGANPLTGGAGGAAAPSASAGQATAGSGTVSTDPVSLTSSPDTAQNKVLYILAALALLLAVALPPLIVGRLGRR